MTVQQIQAAVVSRGLSRKGKNQYTQSAKRTQVAYGYSDCSSFAHWCVLMASGLDIGANTDAQVRDKDMTTVHQGGKLPDLAALQLGDLLYFGGNPSHYLGVGHVEMVSKLGATPAGCELLGHNNGLGPTVKNLQTYCVARGDYLMARRPNYVAKIWTLGQRILSLGCYGEDVAAMQSGLLELGFSVGDTGADMDFGPATDSGVRAFQKAYGLAIDGEFGPNSRGKMNALLAAAQPEAPVNQDPLTEDDLPPDQAPDAAIDPNSDAPTDPTAPADPAAPADPTAPADPIVPADPAAPTNPAVPTDPVAPTNPAAPTVSAGVPDAPMGAGAVNPYPMPTTDKQQGAAGLVVRWIQWELRDSGILSVTLNGKSQVLLIDGDFGPITDAATRVFQKRFGLTVDGIVGPKTREAMLAHANAPGEAPPAVQPPLTPPTGRTGDGADISYYDGVVDWSKVTLPFVFIRVQDDSILDKQLASNIQGAEKYKIPYGHYAFFESSTAAHAQAEVQRMVKRVRDAGGNPSCLVLDVEVDHVTVDAVIAGLKELDKQWPGVQKGIYIAHQLYTKHKKAVQLFDMVWIPRYNNWKTPPAYPYDLWQGGYGSFTGIRGGQKHVDDDRLCPGLTWDALLKKRTVR